MFFCTVIKGEPGKCIGPRCGMAGVGGGAGRVAGVRGDPPGGTFQFQTFILASSQEIWSETISNSEEGPGGEVG